MMNAKIYPALFSVMFLVSPYAHALDCEVKYRAKKVVYQDGVKKVILNSGKKKGTGSSISKCSANALESVKAKGWKITYKSTRVIN